MSGPSLMSGECLVSMQIPLSQGFQNYFCFYFWTKTERVMDISLFYLSFLFSGKLLIQTLALLTKIFRPSVMSGKPLLTKNIWRCHQNLLISKIPKLFLFLFLDQYWLSCVFFFVLAEFHVFRETPENSVFLFACFPHGISAFSQKI